MPRDGKDSFLSNAAIIRIAVVVVGFVFLYYIRDIVFSVLTAVVIASALEPLIRPIMRAHVPRTGAVLIVYALLVAAIAGALVYVLPTIAEEISSIVQLLPEYLSTLTVQSDAFSLFEEGIRDLSRAGSFSDFANGISLILDAFGSSTIEFGTLVFGGVTSGIIIAVLSFYLSTQEDGIGDFLRIVTPLRYEKYAIGLWRRSQRNIGRWMQGQIFLALLVGVFTYIGLYVLGVRNALILSLIAAAFEIIPVFGPILGAIPAVAVGFIDGGVSSALLVAALFVVIQQLESHVMYPIVVRKIVGVPPLIVIISLIVGFKLGGVLGIILSIPLATVLIEYVSDRERNRRVSPVDVRESAASM